MKGYKLFRQDRQGNLHPLYVNATEIIPVGVWLSAKDGEKTENGKVKSRLGELAYRPGWHINDELPYVQHIYSIHGGVKTLKDGCVWAEVECNEKSYQHEANIAGLNKHNIIIKRNAYLKKIPAGGYYRYKTSPNMYGTWLIAGEMRVIRIMNDDEVYEMCENAGLTPLRRYKQHKKVS